MERDRQPVRFKPAGRHHVRPLRLGEPTRRWSWPGWYPGVLAAAVLPTGSHALPGGSLGRQYPYPPPPELEDLLEAGAAAPEAVTSCHTPPEAFSPLPWACPGAPSPV